MHAHTRVNRATIRRSAITAAAPTAACGSSEQLLLRLQRQIGNQVVGRLLHQAGTPMVIQRLSFYDTDWVRATRARHSGSGMTGVLFVEDNTPDALVVKPGDSDPLRETVLAHAMHGKLGKGKVKVPAIRPADSTDRAGIQWVINNRLMPETSREEVLRQFAQSKTVFIMKKASGKNFRELAEESSPVAHGLLASPDYVKRLGMVTAIDLFLGNYDRLYSANLGNWMTAISNVDEMITLIDNFDRYGTQRLTEDNQSMWKDNIATKLQTSNLKATANEILELLLRVFSHSKIDIQLTDKQQEAFKENFAEGLKLGRARILSKLAPRIGRRSRTLKAITVQGEGGKQAWAYLKARADELRRRG